MRVEDLDVVELVISIMNRIEEQLDRELCTPEEIRRHGGNPLTKVVGKSIKQQVSEGLVRISWVKKSDLDLIVARADFTRDARGEWGYGHELCQLRISELWKK